jgi:hypothetical protein
VRMKTKSRTWGLAATGGVAAAAIAAMLGALPKGPATDSSKASVTSGAAVIVTQPAAAASTIPTRLTYLPLGASNVQTKTPPNGALLITADLPGQANQLAKNFGLRVAVSAAPSGQLWLPPADPRYTPEKTITLPDGRPATLITTDTGLGPFHIVFVRNGYEVDVLCDRLNTGSAGISGLSVDELIKVAGGVH